MFGGLCLRELSCAFRAGVGLFSDSGWAWGYAPVRGCWGAELIDDVEEN